MRINSRITNQSYFGERMVYIGNPVQAARYLKHGAMLYDVFENNDKVVFVFSREETASLFSLWCKHELL